MSRLDRRNHLPLSSRTLVTDTRYSLIIARLALWNIRRLTLNPSAVLMSGRLPSLTIAYRCLPPRAYHRLPSLTIAYCANDRLPSLTIAYHRLPSLITIAYHLSQSLTIAYHSLMPLTAAYHRLPSLYTTAYHRLPPMAPLTPTCIPRSIQVTESDSWPCWKIKIVCRVGCVSVGKRWGVIMLLGFWHQFKWKSGRVHLSGHDCARRSEK